MSDLKEYKNDELLRILHILEDNQKTNEHTIDAYKETLDELWGRFSLTERTDALGLLLSARRYYLKTTNQPSFENLKVYLHRIHAEEKLMDI